MLLSPFLSNEVTRTVTFADAHAEFQGTFTVGGSQWYFANQADGTEAWARALSCAVISLMPADGVLEALGAVVDVFRFHTWAMDVREAVLPSPAKVVIAGQLKRPPLELAG